MFQRALRRFDEENARDPNTESVEGVDRPRELVYAERLTDWILRLAPDASEPLRLAARCQHLCRWMIPRDSHPMTRAGYLQWRQTLKQFHAEKSGAILREVGYDEATVGRVQALNLKKNLPSDPEVQVLEDALCLVFLQWQLPGLIARNPEDKVINAIRKSWQKMSPSGRAEALKLSYTVKQQELISKAIRDP